MFLVTKSAQANARYGVRFVADSGRAQSGFVALRACVPGDTSRPARGPDRNHETRCYAVVHKIRVKNQLIRFIHIERIPMDNSAFFGKFMD